LRGLGITFIITGLMGVGFMSFGGINLGSGDKEDDKQDVSVDVDANNDNEPTGMILEDDKAKIDEGTKLYRLESKHNEI